MHEDIARQGNTKFTRTFLDAELFNSIGIIESGEVSGVRGIAVERDDKDYLQGDSAVCNCNGIVTDGEQTGSGKATSHEDERGLRTDRGTANNCIGIERTEEGDEVGYGGLESGTEMCCGNGSEKGDLSWKTGRNSIGIGGSGGLGRGFWTYVVFSKNKGRVGEK